MSEVNAQLGLFAYIACAVAYSGLAALILRSVSRHVEWALFFAAITVTALLGGVTAYGFYTTSELIFWTSSLDYLRTGLWIALLWILIHPELLANLPSERLPRGILIRTTLLLGSWVTIGLVNIGVQHLGTQLQLLSQLILATIGLVLIENLIRRSSAESFWHTKFLCIGLGGVFAYDLFLLSEQFLFQGTSPALQAARGAVLVIAAPLIGIAAWRIGERDFDLSISPSTAFYTGALISAGAYLCLMAVGSVFVRRIGGDAGTAFQAIFLFGAVGLLASLLASGYARGRLKQFISDHFLKLRYDYRREWLRFTETLSQDDPATPIETRALKAIADIFDSPAGAMWLRTGERLVLATSWNMAATSLSAPDSRDLIHALETCGETVASAMRSDEIGSGAGISLPKPVAQLERAWVLGSLVHRDKLLGMFVLAEPRAPRGIDWEDQELLKILGRHAASYIAERLSAQELSETKEFEKLNRRFAFALHDLKNLISRMSLLSSNFAKHGDNKEFRDDMVEALATATNQMKRLMERLQSDHLTNSGASPVRLRPLLDMLVAMDKTTSRLICDDADVHISVIADHDRLAAVFGHLFDNAKQAIDEDGWVTLHLYQQDQSVVVEFVDNGCGMDVEFVERDLFRPFRSTKKSGFGLGAYQCREYIRELGGDLEVISDRGSGTTVRVILPIAGTLTDQGATQPATGTA